MKQILLVLLTVTGSLIAKSQDIDSIYVNLYTDSLKKGTYNYINVDGKTKQGTWLPLDSTQLIFVASEGKFSGNSLWIDRNFAGKVHVKVTMRRNPALTKEFDIWVKIKEDDEKLKTTEEILNEMRSGKTKSKTKSKG